MVLRRTFEVNSQVSNSDFDAIESKCLRVSVAVFGNDSTWPVAASEEV